MSGGATGLASVMHHSLHPKKDERSSAHYPDKASVVVAYKRMVSEFSLVSQVTRDALNRAGIDDTVRSVPYMQQVRGCLARATMVSLIAIQMPPLFLSAERHEVTLLSVQSSFEPHAVLNIEKCFLCGQLHVYNVDILTCITVIIYCECFVFRFKRFWSLEMTELT